MFLMSQVKKSSQCQLRDKKHQYFSIVSLPTDTVIVDHAVYNGIGRYGLYRMSQFWGISEIFLDATKNTKIPLTYHLILCLM
jgi:hypothetical protein